MGASPSRDIADFFSYHCCAPVRPLIIRLRQRIIQLSLVRRELPQLVMVLTLPNNPFIVDLSSTVGAAYIGNYLSTTCLGINIIQACVRLSACVPFMRASNELCLVTFTTGSAHVVEVLICEALTPAHNSCEYDTLFLKLVVRDLRANYR
jgi:hypothetical protein